MTNIDEQPEEGAAKIGGLDPAWPFLRKRLDEKDIQLENSADYLAVLQAMHDYKKSPLHATSAKGVEERAEEFANQYKGLTSQYGDAYRLTKAAFIAGASSAAPVVGDEKWLDSIKPDYDHSESYQHGFHDAIEVVKDKIKSVPIPSTLISELEAANPYKDMGNADHIRSLNLGYENCIAKAKELLNNQK
jgi:hypothetical protein